jgi:hypothetical protein
MVERREKKTCECLIMSFVNLEKCVIPYCTLNVTYVLLLKISVAP